MKRQKIAKFISLLCIAVILLSIFSCAVVQAMSLNDLKSKLIASGPYSSTEEVNNKIESLVSGLSKDEQTKLMKEYLAMSDADKEQLRNDLGLPEDKGWWESTKSWVSDKWEGAKDTLSKFTITGMILELLKTIWNELTDQMKFIEPVKSAIFGANIDFANFFNAGSSQGFQHWFEFFTKIGFALIPVVLLKVAYLTMASFVNPSYKSELKDFIQTFLVYCFVVFAGRELLEFAVNLNNAFVTAMLEEFNKNAANVKHNFTADFVNGIMQFLFGIIVLLISSVMYIYIKILFFVRAIGIGLAYMLMPLAAALLFFKKFKRVLNILVDEIISLVFMQSIYAMSFVLLYSTMAFVLTRIGFYYDTNTGGFFGFLLCLFASGTRDNVELGPLGLLVFLFMLIKIAEKIMKIFGLNLSFTPGAKDVSGFAATTAGALGTAAAYGSDKAGDWSKSPTPKKSEKNVEVQAGKTREKFSTKKDKLNQLRNSGKQNIALPKQGAKASLGRHGISEPSKSALGKTANSGNNVKKLRYKGTFGSKDNISGAKTLPGKFKMGDWLKDKRSGVVGAKLGKVPVGKFAAFSLASGFKLGLLATGMDGDFNSGYDGLEKAWKKTKGTFVNKKTEGQIEFDDRQLSRMSINSTDRVFHNGEDKYAVYKKDGMLEGIYHKQDDGTYKKQLNITDAQIRESLGWKSYEFSTVNKDDKHVFTEVTDGSAFIDKAAQIYGIQLNQSSNGGSGQTINVTGAATQQGMTGGQPVNVQVSGAQQGVSGVAPVGQSGTQGQGVQQGATENPFIGKSQPTSITENIQMRIDNQQPRGEIQVMHVVQGISDVAEQARVIKELGNYDSGAIKVIGSQQYIVGYKEEIVTDNDTGKETKVCTEKVIALNPTQYQPGTNYSEEPSVTTFKVNKNNDEVQLFSLGTQACNQFDMNSLSGAILKMSEKQLQDSALKMETRLNELNGIKESIGTELKALKDEFNKGFDNVGEKIGQGFNGVGEEIGKGFRDVSEEMGRGFTDVGLKIDERMNQVSDNIEKKIDEYEKKDSEEN